ncbi:MAG TPA: hypothetical protein VF629_06565 [Hymenobacter sp.]|jgi:hypothetical protein|uniref:hypothetical protein n=1 Tax=Hymenobacter sp. TaxID=1898978 RepID=UPI002EDAD47B
MLKLLYDTAPVAVYYDKANDWLFADWRGTLTLKQVQAGCLTLARCFLKRSYARVLNSNCDVVSISPEAAPWLAGEFLPHLGLAGIKYLAWVCAPNLLLQHFANEAVRPLSATVVVFDDLAGAYAWLQRAHLVSGAVPHEAARQAEIGWRVAALAEELAHYEQVARLVATPARAEAAGKGMLR